MKNRFTVVQDTREKVGAWDFTWYNFCETQKLKSLKTGDYSIEGLEEKFTIERKRNSAEIAINLHHEGNRLELELERMSKMRFAYFICEFPVATLFRFPEDSGIPKKRWDRIKVSGKYLYKQLIELSDRFCIEMFFVNNKEAAEDKAAELMEEVYSRVKKD